VRGWSAAPAAVRSSLCACDGPLDDRGAYQSHGACHLRVWLVREPCDARLLHLAFVCPPVPSQRFVSIRRAGGVKFVLA
jgi:hypothetical protein